MPSQRARTPERKNVFTVHRSKARRYLDFIRKNSRNPNEFAQFAFNLLMLPDDDASLALKMTREGAPLSRLRNPPASPI